MLHLVQSNNMHSLLQAMLKQLAEQQKPDLFSQQTILVQSPGMAQWLQLKIAEAFGIAANIEFPLPSSFIWRCYQHTLPDLPEQSAFNKQALTWKLMRILPDFLSADDPAFKPLRDYLADAPVGGVKQYLLCHTIADLFDQYLMYRPDWILAWEQGDDHLSDVATVSHTWQPKLWRALVDITAGQGESPYHRANLHQQLLTQLAQGQLQQRNIVLFGISAMPPQQLQVMQALAQNNHVTLYWLNPSQHYWGDVVDATTRALADVRQQAGADYLEVGNPLLSAWGKLGRDFLELLLNIDPQQQDLFELQPASSMLQSIQQEVLNLTHRNSPQALSPQELLSNGAEYPKIAVAHNDHSVKVAQCHSKVRELEALHDHLLHCFNQHADLTPADVIVMVPNIAEYAPYVEGVFGSVRGELHIPYALSDQNLADSNLLLGHFMRLMQLHRSRLTLSECLDLCQMPAVLQRFALDEEAFARLTHWLQDAGVRWGFCGQDKQRWQVPEEEQNTLRFGLKRLLAGYAMHGDCLWQTASETIAPYPDIEGQTAQALGQFALFTESVQQALDFCLSSGSIAQKVTGAITLLEQFYLPDDEQADGLNQLRDKLESLNQLQDYYSEAISQDIFVQQLQQLLTESGVGQGFLAGKVNFCSLMPMRSIPFKQVAILGLNDADYPRQSPVLGFDLMASSTPRRGDRSRRLDDRYLFLEAVLSARQQLYLSYTAFSQKDNSEQPPSLLLQELLTYCKQVFCLQGQHSLPVEQCEQNLLAHICQQHWLQPFNPAYFYPPQAQSFQPRWATVTQARQTPWQDKPLVPEQMLEKAPEPAASDNRDNSDVATLLALNEWLNFFINPARAYIYQRWQVRLPRLNDSLQDDEPFNLHNLDKYQLAQGWLAGTLNTNQLAAQGVLPAGAMGDINLAKLQRDFQPLAGRLSDYMQGDAWRQEIDLPLGSNRLQGWQDRLYGEYLLMWRPGKLRGQDRLMLWLNWLCLCALQQPQQRLQQAVYVSKNLLFSLSPVPREQALNHLHSALALWQRGLQQPLHCYPETAWQWIKYADAEKCLNTFIGNSFSPGEGNEAHIARLCPDLRQQLPALCANADTLYAPMLDYAEEQKC